MLKKKLKILIISALILYANFNSGITAFAQSPNDSTKIISIAGKDRYETSIKTAEYGWTKTNTVLLVNADNNNFADAVSGTALACKLNAPVLFTKDNETPNNILREIEKLKAENIFLLGGQGVISLKQETFLKSKGYSVKRIYGKDRYYTAAKVADILNNKSKIKKAYLTTGKDFKYSAVVTPYVTKENAVILFNDGNYLNSINKEEISKLGIKNIEIIGDEKTVPYSIDSELKKLGIDSSRINKTDIQAISADLLNTNKYNLKGLSVANDSLFPDAIAGAVLNAKNNYGLFLYNGTKPSFNLNSMGDLMLLGQTNTSNLKMLIGLNDDTDKSEYENLKILIDNLEKSKPVFTSAWDSITDKLVKYYFNNETLYSLGQQKLYKDFINFAISNKIGTYDKNISVLDEQAKIYCEKENFNNFGIQGNPINWNSLERDYDWYIDQGSTGAYNNINCVPTSALMAIKYFDKNTALTVSDIRQKSGKTGYMTNEDIENTLKQYGYSHEYIGFDLDNSDNIKNVIKKIINSGNVGIMLVYTGNIPMQSSNSKIGKSYSGSYNHAIVIKGYIETDKDFYVDIYDPYSMGAKDETNNFKGKDVYYTADSLRKSCLLTLTGDQSYKNNAGKTFGGIMCIYKK